MIRAVIFDFDGIISDSEPAHHQAFNQLLADFRICLSKEQYYSKYLGTTDAELLRMISTEYDTDYNGLSIDELVHRKAVIFAELMEQEDHIIEGVSQLLESLTKNNIRIAICSGASAEDINVMLKGSNLKKYFKIIVSADDVDRGKPDPAGYTLALQKLNQTESEPILPNQTAAIEDSHWGLEAAAAAGMHTIALVGSYSAEELSMAELVIGNMTELKIEKLSEFKKASSADID
jgi:beta-phosphoglucomutase